jgi:acetolactate synthase regulatory subunit
MKANTRKAVAANLDMTCVTPRAIAYAMVQVQHVFDTIHISHNFLACSCTLRCADLVHRTQQHELPQDV